MNSCISATSAYACATPAATPARNSSSNRLKTSGRSICIQWPVPGTSRCGRSVTHRGSPIGLPFSAGDSAHRGPGYPASPGRRADARGGGGGWGEGGGGGDGGGEGGGGRGGGRAAGGAGAGAVRPTAGCFPGGNAGTGRGRRPPRHRRRTASRRGRGSCSRVGRR